MRKDSRPHTVDRPISPVTELKRVFRYEPRTGLFYWAIKNRKMNPGDRAGGVRDDGYAYVNWKNRRYYSHRLAWAFVHGRMPVGIDHIDGNPSNNRINNLREATRAQNNQNRRDVAGIYQHTVVKRWVAQIRVPGGKTKHLGIFDTKDEARSAYIKAKRKLHPFGTL